MLKKSRVLGRGEKIRERDSTPTRRFASSWHRLNHATRGGMKLALLFKKINGRMLEGQLAITDGSKRVGSAKFRQLPLELDGTFLEISSILVKEQYRREKISLQMLKELMRLAITKSSAQELRLNVLAENLPAISAYAKFGFREFRRFIEREPLSTEGKEVIVMRMRIKRPKAKAAK